MAQLSLAYGTAALFSYALHSAGGGWARLAALATGVLLVFFFVNTALVFAYLELARMAPRERLLEVALFQLTALLLLAPIVILEVLVYATYGPAGVLLAFFPVVLASFVVRNLSSMERRVAEVSRRNRELDVMREISTSFGGSTRVDRYERVFSAVARLLPVEALAVVEWPGEDGEDFTVHVSERSSVTRREVLAWARRARLDERRIDRDSSPEELAIGESRPIRLADETHHQIRIRLSTFELHSGLLILESASPAVHSAEAIASLRPIADHIALVLQDRAIRAQIQDLAERNRERAETLNQILEISNDLKKNRTLDDLFASIASAVVKSLGFREVVLSLYDRERNVFTPHAHSGLDDRWPTIRQRDLPAEEITRHWTEKNRVSKSFHVLDRSARQTPSGATAAAARKVVTAGEGGWQADELLWIPLYAEDRLLGCLSVDDPKNGTSPTIETIRSLEIFANQAVSAIETARSYNEAREQSVRDSLTGAYNHRHFQEVLQRELGRAERVGRPLTVIMLDIDDFKSINDRFGHPVGDAILQGIVAEIRSEVRGDMDLLARYGGDEFALVLPGDAGQRGPARGRAGAPPGRREALPDARLARGAPGDGLDRARDISRRRQREAKHRRKGGRGPVPGEARRKERRRRDVGARPGPAASAAALNRRSARRYGSLSAARSREADRRNDRGGLRSGGAALPRDPRDTAEGSCRRSAGAMPSRRRRSRCRSGARRRSERASGAAERRCAPARPRRGRARCPAR